MDRCDLLQRLFDMFLAQQLAEHIENDAIGDAKEEMEWSWDDAIRGDGEESRMSAIDGMLVCCGAVTSCFGEAIVIDDADGAGMSGRRSHEAEQTVDEWPVAIEEGLPCKIICKRWLRQYKPKHDGEKQTRRSHLNQRFYATLALL